MSAKGLQEVVMKNIAIKTRLQAGGETWSWCMRSSPDTCHWVFAFIDPVIAAPAITELFATVLTVHNTALPIP